MDISGEVYQHVEYLPFGELFVEERNTEQDRFSYLYNGKELDEMTGLSYYGARYYNPRDGMFLGVDPLMEDYIFQSPFAYAANNPIRYIDNNGEGPIEWIIQALGITERGAVENYISRSNITDPAQKNMIMFAAGWGQAASGSDPVLAGVGYYKMIYNFWEGNVKLVNKAVTEGATTDEAINQVFSPYIDIYDGFDEMISSALDGDYYAMGEASFTIIATIAAGKAGSAKASSAKAGAQSSKAVCFVEGTKVKTDQGDKSIEDIQVGDQVWSFNVINGRPELKAVEELFISDSVFTLYRLKIEKEVLITTPEHPFYISGEWTFTKDLFVGDTVTLLNNTNINIITAKESLDSLVTVYNFKVSDNNNYYVTSSGILVHNNPCAQAFKSQWGWRGTKAWNSVVKQVKGGGTIQNLNGIIPTKVEALQLLKDAGVNFNKNFRIEGSHLSPNPHTYPHINYTTPSGIKGTIQIQNL